MVQIELFGTMASGTEVNQYILENETGMTVKLLNYGGIIRELWVPDRFGHAENSVLSYDNLEDYIENPGFVGAVVGRTAGRLRKGALPIGDRQFSITQNNNGNTLHGGACGFHQKVMAAAVIEDSESMGLNLKFVSPDGECGYPGTLNIEIKYRLMKKKNVLTMEMKGTSDQKTYLNMTNHSYFNLSGESTSIADHQLRLVADAYVPVDEAMLPRGSWQPVAGSVFDMRTSRKICSLLGASDEQIYQAKGIDHPFRLMKCSEQKGNTLCAELHDPKTGRTMSVYTTQPHLVVYTGNYLHVAEVPGNKLFCQHQGICFEAQEVPDAPGNPAFDCNYLEPGEEYSQTIEYVFS